MNLYTPRHRSWYRSGSRARAVSANALLGFAVLLAWMGCGR